MSVDVKSWSRFRAWGRVAAVLAIAGVLAACGGGGGGDSGSGGGTLTVSLSYTGNAELFQQSTLSPTITGLSGHSPNCSLVSGSLPTGMTLHADCSITGVPLQSGSFPIVVRLGASGVSNQLDWNASVLVMGPSVVYSVPAIMTAGASYDLPPLNTIFWTATPADAITYTVAEGALPPGLAVDPVTGHIAGTPTTGGTYTFKIGVQIVNAGRTATAIEQFTELVTVYQPVITYSRVTAIAGLSFSASPSLPGTPTYTFSATALPPGLSINTATGVISGTPSALANGTYRVDLAAATAGGGTYTTFANVPLQVNSPVDITWSSPWGAHGAPFSSFPVIQAMAADPLTGISYAYAVDPASVLPTGLVLDPVTGHITGTPTTAGSITTRIDVTITLYGTVFVVPVDVLFTFS